MHKGKHLTRRDFGRGIAAILAASAAPSVLGGGMMRNLGGRLAALSGGGVANPYDLGDGSLIGMWMPLWNAGLGRYDPARSTLADISGCGHDMNFVGNYTLYDDSLFVDAGNVYPSSYGYVDGLSFGPCVTQEFCTRVTFANLYARFAGENRGLTFASRSGNGINMGHLYGFGKDVGFNTVRTYDFGSPATNSQTLTVGSTAKYYLNGASVGASIPISSQYVYNGRTAFFNRGSGNPDRGMSCHVFCVRFYNRELSAAEVERNHRTDARLFGFTI